MLLFALLTLTGCSGCHKANSLNAKGWDDELNRAIGAHDMQRVLFLIDSLEQTECIMAPYADYLRGRGYDFCAEQHHVAEHFYKKVYDSYRKNPQEDWLLYADAGYRLAALRNMRMDLKGALSVATEMMTVAEKNDSFPIGIKSALLMLLANCQSQLHQPELARKNYMLAYDAELKDAGGEGNGEMNPSGYFARISAITAPFRSINSENRVYSLA